MDHRWQPLPKDGARDVSLALYDAETLPPAIVAGAAAVFDLTPLVSRLGQTDAELSFTLSWHDELDWHLPQSGQWVCVRLSGRPLCVQRVDALTDYRVMHGVKQVSVTARARDATDRWRDQQLSTRTYAIGAPAIEVVNDVAEAMGLADTEVLVTQLSTVVPRASVQLSGVSAWTALEQVMLPAGLSPSVDALGRLRGVSRDVLRDADVVLTDDRVEGFSGSRSSAPATRLSLRWRAPELVPVLGAERVLGQATLSAGMFKLRQVRRVYFSADRTQRATNLRLVVRESANSGLFPVADEKIERLGYDAASASGAAVVVETRKFSPVWLGLYMGAKLITAASADYHAWVVTIPFGRLLEAAVDIATLVLLTSFGQGQYDIMGQPLDAVEQVHTTDAYDPAASPASSRREVIESDFVASLGHAIAFVTREFIWRARAATTWSLTIVDDPRIEVGDIVQLSDGTRLCVTGFRRDLSHASSALLDLTGFPA